MKVSRKMTAVASVAYVALDSILIAADMYDLIRGFLF